MYNENSNDKNIDIDFPYMYQCTSIFGNVSDCPNYIKSLTIPESVKTIWPSAFSGSNPNNGYKYGLGCKSLTIPGNVTEIGAGAFKYAKFEQVAIPDAVKNIYRETFDRCGNLKSINLGNGVEEIWDDAFRDIANNAELVIMPSLLAIRQRYLYHMARRKTIGANGVCSVTWNLLRWSQDRHLA